MTKRKTVKKDPDSYLLGKGRLAWWPEERASGRYGTIFLTDWDGGACRISARSLDRFGGKHGTLVAVIKKRYFAGRVIGGCGEDEPVHKGDRARGHYPKTPDSGETIPLGEGFLFVQEGRHWGSRCIGVSPPGGNASTDYYPWMDPKSLYKAHAHLVELRWFPGGMPILQEGGIE